MEPNTAQAALDALQRIITNHELEQAAKEEAKKADEDNRFQAAKEAAIKLVVPRLTQDEGLIFKQWFTGMMEHNKGSNRRTRYELLITGYADIWLDLPANQGKPTYWLVRMYEDESFYQYKTFPEALVKAKAEQERQRDE